MCVLPKSGYLHIWLPPCLFVLCVSQIYRDLHREWEREGHKEWPKRYRISFMFLLCMCVPLAGSPCASDRHRDFPWELSGVGSFNLPSRFWDWKCFSYLGPSTFLLLFLWVFYTFAVSSEEHRYPFMLVRVDVLFLPCLIESGLFKCLGPGFKLLCSQNRKWHSLIVSLLEWKPINPCHNLWNAVIYHHAQSGHFFFSGSITLRLASVLSYPELLLRFFFF